MRFLLTAGLCLSMAVCILANDFNLGERQEGDHSVIDKTIFKPALSLVSRRVTIPVTCPLLHEIITYVKISSLNDNEVDFQLFDDVGMRSLMVIARGKEGEELSLKVDGYCIGA
ncbi:uncharacterized protein LOC105185034 [Harpegnathos saltator]|uniref:uncharacterized protein LOC105185034 n=1 Tax=Harpegnathos saltator TaxID=610380 RepID=UPI00058B8D78|nr:uncharacterized protein LOC105185034 [Harpegnathos saltator]